jgi:microfibrillar-associated protein 1
MQKYYFKGAFFQDNAQGNLDHLYNRDYNLPTSEDKVNKSALPKVLQKRKGMACKKGQSKYTHLTAEDTTCHDPYFKVPKNIANKLLSQYGGYKSNDTFNLTGKKRK